MKNATARDAPVAFFVGAQAAAVAAAARQSRATSFAAGDAPWLNQSSTRGIASVFEDAMQEVYALDMYHEYWKTGWTPKLARKTRTQLMPIIFRTVTFAWYSALQESER